jgi:signal transduction histidine kinase
MRESREELTRRWLERISERVLIPAGEIFPTDELLDHVPVLIEGIAEYVADPADEISAEGAVLDKATELGRLRHAQGFPAHQILKEYEILGGILYSFVADEAEAAAPEEIRAAEMFSLAHRIFRAVATIQQVTTAQYLQVGDERVAANEERLRGFNRMVSHELKNRIGAVLGAAELLGDDIVGADPARRDRFTGMIVENARSMQAILDDLVALSRTEAESRRQRNVLLEQAATEAARQLRESAAEAGVGLRIAEDLPPVEVNAAAVELCLANLLSNAIKYSDASKEERWVRVTGSVEPEEGEPAELVVCVEDNGLGVPEEARERLFERFFRAHGGAKEGTGLGLSIVRETVEALGGRTWAEFPPEGHTRFAFALPCRRRGPVSSGSVEAGPANG